MQVSRALLGVVCVFVFAAACSFARAGQRGLEIGSDDRPPYEFVEHGRYRGIALDILLTALERMDESVAGVDQYPWARGLRLLEGGGLDVLCCGIEDVARKSFVRYHEEPLFASRFALFVRARDKESLEVLRLSDLDGRTLGVVRGYSYSEEINAYLRTRTDLVEVSTDAANLELLLRGRVQYALGDLLNCLALRRRMSALEDVEPLEGPALSGVGIYALFNRDRVPQPLVDRFDVELRAMRDEGVIRGIVRRYLP